MSWDRIQSTTTGFESVPKVYAAEVFLAVQRFF